MKFKLLLVALSSLALIMLCACSAAKATDTTTAAQTATSASATASVQGPAKTLKIGMVTSFGGGMGLDLVRGATLMAKMENKAGGLTLNGETYNVEIVPYDSKDSQATEVAAANRMVFEDKVKYIVTDGGNIGAWLPITEANKVIVSSLIPVPPLTINANLHYSIHAVGQNCLGAVAVGWFCKNYPEQAKSYTLVIPDSQGGRNVGGNAAAAWKVFGIEPNIIYYPANSVDMSSIGTKIKTLNPGSFGAIGGGAGDGLALRAAWDAGYRGQYFTSTPMTSYTMLQYLPLEATEGFINTAGPCDFEQPVTEVAKTLKEAWVAEYGKWESPDITGTAFYACYREAIKKAGTTDVDKVIAVLDNGFSWESPIGITKMVSRPDMGVTRTADSLATVYMKTMKGGQPVLLATVGMDEGMTYFQKMIDASKSNTQNGPGAP